MRLQSTTTDEANAVRGIGFLPGHDPTRRLEAALNGLLIQVAIYGLATALAAPVAAVVTGSVTRVNLRSRCVLSVPGEAG